MRGPERGAPGPGPLERRGARAPSPRLSLRLLAAPAAYALGAELDQREDPAGARAGVGPSPRGDGAREDAQAVARRGEVGGRGRIEGAEVAGDQPVGNAPEASRAVEVDEGEPGRPGAALDVEVGVEGNAAESAESADAAADAAEAEAGLDPAAVIATAVVADRMGKGG